MNDYGSSAIFHSEVFLAYYEPYRAVPIPSDEFFNDYWIRPSHTAFAALRTIDPKFVWTIVLDDSTRNVYYATGFHIVNREGYVVTKRSHAFELIDFCEYWRRPFLTDLGLKREMKKLKTFLARTPP